MNERIKLLAEQAGGNPNYKSFRGHFLPPPPDYIDPATVDLEKFAELIIRECMLLCQECVDDGCVEAEEPLSKIKQHFGVEE